MSLGTFPVMQRCPSAPSTYQGTKPASNVPRAMLRHVSGYETQGKRSPPRANTEPHPRNEIAPVQQKRLTAPQHVPRHIPGHVTGSTAPSTYQGTKPALTVPRAVLQHVSGYDSRGKRSRARAGAMVSCRNPWRLRARVVNWNCGCVKEWRHRHARL